MSKVITFDRNEMTIRNHKIGIQELLFHYDFEKVVGYCKACPKYDKIWSCPSFDFSTYDYLNKFSSAIIYSGEIIFDLSTIHDDDQSIKRRQIFDHGRKAFREFLMTVEKQYDESEALIAGHCFLCEQCTRINGKKCAYPKEIRYSLEGMGIEVGNLLKTTLNQELRWDTETSDRLMTVGAILIK